MNINKDISNYFLTDARDYLSRYNILKENSTHLGSRSKLLIELLFAIECSLKSLIFLESKENEKLTYEKIKSHNFTKLYNLLNPNSKSNYKKIIKEDLSEYYVHIRYQLESEIDFRNKNGVLAKKYYSTIANFNWLDNIYKQIKQFIDFIDTKNKVDLTPISFAEIDIDKEIEKHNLLVNIRKKAHNKGYT